MALFCTPQGGSSSVKYISLKTYLLDKNSNKLFLPKRNTSAKK